MEINNYLHESTESIKNDEKGKGKELIVIVNNNNS